MKNTEQENSYPDTALSAVEDDGCFGSNSASKSKIYFNAIDKALEILEDDKELAEKVPSCVVVGMQSVGKSAILSRISGIRFPQDSEVCTRVAIELRLRRARGDQDANKPMLIKAGNSKAIEVDKFDQDGVENALKAAQKEVLNGREFEDKLSVKVEKEDVDLPEVTLIDLPGIFFAKDDAADSLEAQVKQMIQERVRNEMALILHVVPLNQDTDTISTWRTVRDADIKQERTISVLTKADLALKDKNGKEKLEKRLLKILEDSKSSECFVLHGAAKSSELEVSQLSKVSNYIEELNLGGQIKVGVKELNDYIEERMLEHIKDKIPKMRELLEIQRSCSEKELDKLGRVPILPSTIARRATECMKQHLGKAYKLFQPEHRRLVETMSQEILKIDPKPLGIVDADEANRTLSQNWDNSVFAKPEEVSFKDHLLALEAKKISEDYRAMINPEFVGTRSELTKWLKTFAEPLHEILTKYIADVFESFDRKIFQPSIWEGSSEPTKQVRRHMELKIRKNLIFTAKSDVMDSADSLVDSVKRNTFTSNEDYLSDTMKKLEDKMNDHLGECLKNSYRLEMQRHYRVICEIRAFFKARKINLPDTIQLHVTKALDDLYNKTRLEIEDQMVSKTSVALIKESTRSIARRKFHLERERKLINALDEISLL